MGNKVKVITSPDLIFDRSYKILLVTPSEQTKKFLEHYISDIITSVSIYIYEGHEKDIKWLLTVASSADHVIIDVDNATTDLEYFMSYLISLPNSFYKTEHMKAPWDLLNPNRFFDFPHLTSRYKK
jgi:hypothetical protein